VCAEHIFPLLSTSPKLQQWIPLPILRCRMLLVVLWGIMAPVCRGASRYGKTKSEKEKLGAWGSLSTIHSCCSRCSSKKLMYLMFCGLAALGKSIWFFFFCFFFVKAEVTPDFVAGTLCVAHGRASRVHDRCTALEQHCGCGKDFSRSRAAVSLSVATGRDCVPNRSTSLAQNSHASRQRCPTEAQGRENPASGEQV
jgi:hypothetical protein